MIDGVRVYQFTSTNETGKKVKIPPKYEKGIYFVKVMDGKDQFTRKMVVN